MTEAFKYAKQANARITREENFRKFVVEKNPALVGDHAEAKAVSALCGVEALRFIDESPEAISKWEALDAEYKTWLGS